MSDWTSKSNEALRISLVRASEDRNSLAEQESYESFHPQFTYPIYGEDEKLYGYKDLDIDLRFTSGSLVQYLNVNFAEKLGSTSTVDDVEGTLSEFIPPDYLKDEEKFIALVENDATNFKPSGQLIHSYTRLVPSAPGEKGKSTAQNLDSESDDAVVFEVYHFMKTTWNTPGFKEYHRRMQLFILLYIEGGSYINEDEDAWEYEKRKRRGTSGVVTYHFVGYSSLYPFYFFPEKTQLTVEDPAEAFEDLRDRNDLKMLISNQRFMEEGFGGVAVTYGGGRVGGIGRAGKSGRGGKAVTGMPGKMGPPSDKTWLENWRRELKIAGRQFQRLVEMLILLRLDPSDMRVMRAYRIQVKERLYRFNFVCQLLYLVPSDLEDFAQEILAQMEKQERLDKLEETFQSVIEDYQRILAMVR
ncbi:hypothetical protein H0H81_009872 [Sphagnurus paluster]|uniref:Histone acetyltransferase type B catalytic subunit n=1 Tax=Sphagnurus paluster TaxID=117069 RepID=A0A9P7GJD6_9AGAR|nr:hypothetical protein H0H81_009872 [Sphagnurus paluster]